MKRSAKSDSKKGERGKGRRDHSKETKRTGSSRRENEKRKKDTSKVKGSDHESPAARDDTMNSPGRGKREEKPQKPGPIEDGAADVRYMKLLREHQNLLTRTAVTEAANAALQYSPQGAGSVAVLKSATTRAWDMAHYQDGTVFAEEQLAEHITSLSVLLRQAIRIANERRTRGKSFTKTELHSVLELYESLGLNESSVYNPLNELQRRISHYRFPPPNMHLLRTMDQADPMTVEYVLGKEEIELRAQEGTEIIPLLTSEEINARRPAVSGEGTCTFLQAPSNVKRVSKSSEQAERLWLAMEGSALFKTLEKTEMKVLFNAFEMEQFKAGRVIFDQGDPGNRFFLIDNGRCEIVVRDAEGFVTFNTFVGIGDTFGELALMYGTPRAATVTAIVDTVCWWIDRETYRGILLKTTTKKRERYISFLKNMTIFQSATEYELARIADVLEPREFSQQAAVIIREREHGDVFFIVEEGEVMFVKDGKEMSHRGGPGSFFGEMALLFDTPRAVTVMTASPFVRLICLSRAQFNSYLGPFDNILRRNAEQYNTYVKKASSD